MTGGETPPLPQGIFYLLFDGNFLRKCDYRAACGTRNSGGGCSSFRRGIFAFEGDEITLIMRNALDEDYRIAIPAAGPGFVTPTVTVGAGIGGNPPVTFTFTVPKAGTYLYYDDLNAPVNRVMGLHGALIVMPNPATGTPYNSDDVVANPNMAQLFADLGTAAWGRACPGERARPIRPAPTGPPSLTPRSSAAALAAAVRFGRVRLGPHTRLSSRKKKQGWAAPNPVCLPKTENRIIPPGCRSAGPRARVRTAHYFLTLPPDSVSFSPDLIQEPGGGIARHQGEGQHLPAPGQDHLPAHDFFQAVVAALHQDVGLERGDKF